jgi:hypothetical protein
MSEGKKTYAVLVLTNLWPRSAARHAWGDMVIGLRANGCGSTIPREMVRHIMRAWVGEGIVCVCVFLFKEISL